MGKTEFAPDSIQTLSGGVWWVRAASPDPKRGRLLRAIVPFVQQVPREIQATRASATDHQKASFELVPMRVREVRKGPSVPVAALHTNPGEVNAVYKAKIRPVVVISTGGDAISSEVLKKAKGWKTAPTLIVAPYFGVDQDGSRAGWDAEFVSRIRHGEYPQYVHDRLPIGGDRRVDPQARSDATDWSPPRLVRAHGVGALNGRARHPG